MNKRKQGKQAPRTRPSTVRILFIGTDSACFQDISGRLEKEFSIRTKSASTADDVQTRLDKSGWEVVFYEYGHKAMTFPKALKAARESDPEIPFIVITGEKSENLALGLMRKGASEIIWKNSYSRLVPAVEREIRDADHRRKRTRAERSLQVTLDIAYELNKKPDIESALMVALTRLCQATDWDYGECWICDKDKNELRLMPGWIGDQKAFRTFRGESEKMVLKYGEAIPGHVVRTGEPIWIEDVISSRLTKFLRARLARKAGFESAFAVPVKRQNGDVFAVLYFFYIGRRERDEDLVNLVSSITTHIGIFLETRLKELELLEKTTLMESLLESMDQGILYFDRDRDLRLYNRRTPDLLDIPAEDFKSLQTYGNVVTYFAKRGDLGEEGTERRARAEAHLQRLKEGKTSRYQRTTPSGKTLEVRGQSTPDGGVIVTYIDITQTKKTEGELAHMQRLESIGNLSGGIAHDFNNLLMVITGNLDLLEEEVPDNPEAMEAVHTALRATEKGEALTRQMLAFSRQQPLDPKTIDISENITEMLGMLSRMIGEDVEIDWQPASDPRLVTIDPVQFESALLNLVVNAKQAMPDGGTITITAETIDLNEGYIETHRNMKPGEYVRLSVTDEGTGMPEKVRERIFDPYFTTKTGGSGMGLAMVYGFVKQSGGYIRVYSETGVGTRFRIYLPCADEKQKSKRDDSEEAPLQLRKGARVLVIEDNQQVRSTVVRQIKSMGLKVEEAENVREGLEILEEKADAIDLVFSDVVMPGRLSGLDLYKIVHEKWPGLGVILTSGFPDKVFTKDNTDLRPDILSKPYRKSELVKAFAKHISERGRSKGRES